MFKTRQYPASAYDRRGRRRGRRRDEDARCGAGGVRRAAGRPGGRARRPEGGRGAGPARRLRRLPHRPLHGLRRRPVRLRADGARPRGRRRRRGGRPGRQRRSRSATTSSPCSRPSAASASTASTSAPTSAWRSASSRTRATCPTGPPACSRDGEEIRHFMGTSTFAEYTVMPEIALAKVDPGGAARPRLPVRLRALDRARRGDEHRQGRARARPASSSAPAWSASAPSPAAACRAPSGSSASTSPTTGSSWRRARARPRR